MGIGNRSFRLSSRNFYIIYHKDKYLSNTIMYFLNIASELANDFSKKILLKKLNFITDSKRYSYLALAPSLLYCTFQDEGLLCKHHVDIYPRNLHLL